MTIGAPTTTPPTSTPSTATPPAAAVATGNVLTSIENSFTKARAWVLSELSHLQPADQTAVTNLLTNISTDVKSDASAAMSDAVQVLTGQETAQAAISSFETTVMSEASQVGGTAESTLTNAITDAIDAFVESKGGALGTDAVPVLNSAMTTGVNALETYIAGLGKAATAASTSAKAS